MTYWRTQLHPAEPVEALQATSASTSQATWDLPASISHFARNYLLSRYGMVKTVHSRGSFRRRNFEQADPAWQLDFSFTLFYPFTVR